jgi:hypothetical protein
MDKTAPTLMLTILTLSGIGNVSARAVANMTIHKPTTVVRRPFPRRILHVNRLEVASV